MLTDSVFLLFLCFFFSHGRKWKRLWKEIKERKDSLDILVVVFSAAETLEFYDIRRRSSVYNITTNYCLVLNGSTCQPSFPLTRNFYNQELKVNKSIIYFQYKLSIV